MIGWWIGGVLLGIVLIDLVVRIPFIRVATGFFEQMPEFNVVPGEPNDEAERVEFPTTDGLVLRGSIHRHRSDGPPVGVCVFAPELGGTHWTAPRYADALLDLGFDLLAFEFRNQGESDALPGYQPMHWLTRYEIDDLSAAVAYARSLDGYGDLPLLLFGVSRGGGTALAVASRRDDVDRVWVDSGFSTSTMVWHFAQRWAVLVAPEWMVRILPNWHVRNTLMFVRWYSWFRTGRPYRSLEPLLSGLRTTPVQFVCGSRDTYVPPVIAEELARRIGDSADVWIVAKAKHNGARHIARDEYDERLRNFVSTCTATTLATAATVAEGLPS